MNAVTQVWVALVLTVSGALVGASIAFRWLSQIDKAVTL